MTKRFLLFSAIAFLVACSADVEDHGDSADSINIADSLRKLDSTAQADSVSRIELEDTLAKDTVPAEPLYPAKFRIQYTSAYCGGARPSEEILAEYATPKPLSNSWIRFRNHFTGKEYVLQTNSDGVAFADMEESKYDLFFTKDINPKLNTGFDPKCSLWMNQILLTVKVSSTGKSQDVLLHFICNPCDQGMKTRP